MHQRIRRATMTVIVVLPVAGTSLLAAPGTAHAETQRVPCGTEVTAKPGDRIVANLHEGAGELLTFDLGTVHESTTGLVGTGTDLLGSVLGLASDLLCKVTVKVADTVDQVPAVGDTAGKAITNGAEQLNETAHETTNTVTETLPPAEPSGESPTTQREARGEHQTPSNESLAGHQSDDGTTEQTGDEQAHTIAAPASPAVGGGTPLQPVLLPSEFSSGTLPCGTTRGCRMRCPASSPPPPGFATARASRVTHPSSISSGHRTRRTTGPVNEPRHGAPLLPTTQRPERATPEQFPG